MIGVVVLAAGASRRLGRPKQLVEWKGETLLRRAAKRAVEFGCGPVVVVLGYKAQEMRPELEGLAVRASICDEWEDGVGRSLAFGIETLARYGRVLTASTGSENREMKQRATIQGAIVMTCDQPELTVEVLHGLLQKWAAGCCIAACSYGGTIGVPALFDSSCFEHLMTLRGDKGAKEILLRNAKDLGLIPFPGGLNDIDHPENLP